ncbi:MAG: ABC transporter ATP-binding protein [Clostridia bacterium]|nr:ABC transporter ATP-binding protein [Clostridia bacterium]
MKEWNSKDQGNLKINNLTIRFFGRPILENLSFEIEKGKLGIVLGPNGVGKSSLLKAIAGLIGAERGEVYINGLPASRMNQKEQARLVSYLPQGHPIAYNYSVQDFVLMGRTPYLGVFGVPGIKDLQIAFEALRYLGIPDMAKRGYLSLSSGERQMVLLARSLVQGAGIMVMDEPTTYLDYQRQYYFMEKLKKMIKKYGYTAIVSLHDPGLALKFADKMILLFDKKKLAEIDCQSKDYLSKFDACMKVMYGPQVDVRKVGNDAAVLWNSDK